VLLSPLGERVAGAAAGPLPELQQLVGDMMGHPWGHSWSATSLAAVGQLLVRRQLVSHQGAAAGQPLRQLMSYQDGCRLLSVYRKAAIQYHAAS
jgi:hypothetical protein